MEYSNGLLPVIDFEDLPYQSSKLIKACEEWGCFRLFNHHRILPPSLMADMKEVVRSLLDLPVEIKKLNKDNVVHGSGYFPLSPMNPIVEALGLYDMSCPSDIDAFCSQLDASPHQRETIMKYAAAIHELLLEVGQKICDGLGLANVSFEGWPCQFRFNKYSFTPEAVGSTAACLHTYIFFLIILQDDEEVGGLEVMNKSGEFVAVEPCPNSLLVNMGDVTTAWSNGRFNNVKHRVMCKEAKTRVSIVSFIRGPKDTTVETPFELVDNEHPRLYVPFTPDDLAKLRHSEKIFTGEGLDHFRTNSGNFM